MTKRAYKSTRPKTKKIYPLTTRVTADFRKKLRELSAAKDAKYSQIINDAVLRYHEVECAK